MRPAKSGRGGRAASQRRRGAVFAEFLLVLVAFLMLIFAVFEFGRPLMLRQRLVNAAREGARAAVTGTYSRTSAEIEAIVRAQLSGLDPESVEVSLFEAAANGSVAGPWTDAAFGERIGVRVQAWIHPLFPNLGILPNPMLLGATSIQRSEGD